jgi:hypothetical protein
MQNTREQRASDYATRKQAGAFLHASLAKVDRLIKQHKLKKLRVGRRTQISWIAIRKLAEGERCRMIPPKCYVIAKDAR